MKVNIKKFAAKRLTDEQCQLFLKAYLAVLVCNNNVHWIHWNAKGPKFDRIHSLAEYYYEELSKDVDFIAELCIQHGVEIFNPLGILNYMTGEEMLTSNEYGYEEAVTIMANSISKYRKAIKDLSVALSSDEFKGDQSALDDILAYWDKEVDYKFERRT